MKLICYVLQLIRVDSQFHIWGRLDLLKSAAKNKLR